MTLMTFAILGLAALASGMLSAIAGNGGLIILPVLLILGIPPQIALGTNRLYTTSSLSMSTYYFIKKGLFNPHFWIATIIATLVGIVIGVGLIHLFSNSTLKLLLPILMLAMAAYLLLPPKLIFSVKAPVAHNSAQGLTASSLLGVYSGFLGAGTGSLWTTVAVSMFNMDIMEASAISRFMCFISNALALCIFMGLHQVNYSLGSILALGGMLGAYLGSRLAFRWGAKFTRFILISSTLIMAVQLAFEYWV